MVGKFDRDAGQNINRRAMGTGFISAMLGLGVLCKRDSLPSSASKRQPRAKVLILGHGRPGKCNSNILCSSPHRTSSKAHLFQTDTPNYTKEQQPQQVRVRPSRFTDRSQPDAG